MFAGMVLASFIRVSGAMQAMAMRHVRVVRHLFMTSSFMMFSRLAMMLGRVLVMIRGLMTLTGQAGTTEARCDLCHGADVQCDQTKLRRRI
jgi:hypothetical protein